jgi:hypothetical protein
MSEWQKRFSREAAREVISQIVWSYWPYWGAPLMSAILFHLNGYPSGIVFLAGLAAFALVALGLNNYSQWMATQSPSGRVDFLAPTLNLVGDLSTDPPTLRGIKLGVSLRSIAPFPMEIRIDDIVTQIGDRVPTEPFYGRSITVSRGIAATFNNGMIDLSTLDRADLLIYGRISAAATYGRPGRLKYPVQGQWYMALKFDKDGNFQTAESSLTEFSKENSTNQGAPPLRQLPPSTQGRTQV